MTPEFVSISILFAFSLISSIIRIGTPHRKTSDSDFTVHNAVGALCGGWDFASGTDTRTASQLAVKSLLQATQPGKAL